MRKTIMCLANSYKHGGRCIAGIDLDSNAWIRLGGNSPDGALCPAEYVLDDGSEPRLLDLIEVELHYALPSAAHPEDWQIAPVRWRLIHRPASPAQLQAVTASADKATTILRGYCDRMSADEIRQKPMQSSLALVCPSDLHWWIRGEGTKRKYRALFRRHHVTYDFALTDPRWLERLDLLPAGIYPHATFAGPAGETWLTVSLSEPFHGWHYKLVAAVIPPSGTVS
ncbi:MAG TPA: hypothetical protein VGU23_03305 [Acidobacteriaceae bacterium]|nr:hypothetical protein [Acidobacteriaceae bacterium]